MQVLTFSCAVVYHNNMDPSEYYIYRMLRLLYKIPYPKSLTFLQHQQEYYLVVSCLAVEGFDHGTCT